MACQTAIHYSEADIVWISKPRYIFLSLCAIVVITSSHGTISPSQARTLDPAATPVQPQKLRRAIDQGEIASAIAQLELGWKYQFEQYYQRRFTIPYLNLAGIQLRLHNLHRSTQQKTALIYAVAVEDRLEVIMVPPTGRPIHRAISGADRQTLIQTAQDFRLESVNPDSTPEDYLPPAQQLYDWLIKPIAPDLENQQIDTLIFCVGQGLRGLPIAALHDGRQFLIEQYNLALIPAFNLLDHKPSRLDNVKMLAMGASEFQDKSALPGVPIELANITQNKFSSEVLLNQDFTLQNFMTARAQNPYGIVHMATHASVTANSAQDSYIQFWDQRLSLDQVKSLQLQTPVVQLLVLSACQTALGNAEAELGFAGFAVQSGAKAVIASLWNVDDLGTLVLMSELYQHLGKTNIKAQALRQAQVNLLRGNVTIDNSAVLKHSQNPALRAAIQSLNQRDLKHPYYWAAFTLIGNPW